MTKLTLGWEHHGTYHPWSGSIRPEEWQAAWSYVVAALRPCRCRRCKPWSIYRQGGGR